MTLAAPCWLLVRWRVGVHAGRITNELRLASDTDSRYTPDMAVVLNIRREDAMRQYRLRSIMALIAVIALSLWVGMHIERARSASRSSRPAVYTVMKPVTYTVMKPVRQTRPGKTYTVMQAVQQTVMRPVQQMKPVTYTVMKPVRQTQPEITYTVMQAVQQTVMRPVQVVRP
jgi:YTV